jgi:hypothetical protein
MFFPLSKLYLKRAIENEGSRPQLVQEIWDNSDLQS